MEYNNKKWNVQDAMISMFRGPIKTSKGQTPDRTGNLWDVYNVMMTPQMKRHIETLRSIKDEKAQKDYKALHLPYVTFSGTFTHRNAKGLLQHSGLLCFDFDHLGGEEEVLRVKHLLAQDPVFETQMMFTSPRGDGVKWVTDIDLERASHEVWYKSIANYLWETYQLVTDRNPSNVASACFLSYDTNMYINPVFGVL